MIKTYGCWYEPGDAGTWLTWFINQHKDFPKFTNVLRYEQEGNPLGHIPSDYSCWDSDWHVVKWEGHDKQTWAEFIDNANDISDEYSSVCYKVLPYHNPFSVGPNEVDDLDQHSFADLLIEQSNTNLVIIPIIKSDYELFAKRLAFIRPRFTVDTARDIYKHRIDKIYDNNILGTQSHVDVLTVCVDQLIIHQDYNEYSNLCRALGQPELDNWKDIVADYYNTVYAPWADIDDNHLDSRPETLESKNKNENSYL